MNENNKIRLFPRERWPKALLEISHLPKRLYIRGAEPSNGQNQDPDHELINLCIVGSRKFTDYGKEACQMLIKGLAGYPICIVSGLALGIDAIAHEAALDAGLRTIAFPGSGLDPRVLYPRYNIKLAEKIVDAGGTLLSEFEPELRAAPWTFPQRNRLMAGISKAVLLIEAEERSGTLITARYATEYNRDVLALPGSIFSANSAGPNGFIRLGATPITKSEDILRALNIQMNDETKEKALERLDLSEQEKIIIALLKSEPQNKESLQQKSGLAISELHMSITLLEIKSLIREQSGTFYLT